MVEMNGSSARKLVGVSGDPEGRRYGFLFRALGELYPIKFRNIEAAGHDALDALIVLDGDLTSGLVAATSGTPSYVVMRGQGEVDNAAARPVRFGTSTIIEPCLRNQVMVIEREDIAISPIVAQAGDVILASEAARPIWMARPTGRGLCQVVDTPPPELRPNEFLFQHLKKRRCLGLLYLLHFLRHLVRALDWEGPPPQACFVFDDPSLHWRSYGFLNYRVLADHAVRHNYCASVATIPLDAWWVNAGVAATLRSCSPRISVLIHGNNHTTGEMLSQRSAVDRLALAAQAMRRMERLARRHGIPFLKIMEAPHGAMAADMFPHLLALGYEAALCTPELLVQHNPRTAWPAAFGLDRSDMLGGGLPVIPRIRMSSHWRNDVLLAAFLRQPIIIAGHHYDAANRMEFLEELADMVNQMEGVVWSDLREILRTNCRQRIEGDVLIVKMYSRRVRVAVAPGVRQLSVWRPWLEEDDTERLVIALDSDTKTLPAEGPMAKDIELGATGTRIVEIASEIEHPLGLSSINSPLPSPWPLARKMLMEIRDRLSPMMPAVDRLRRPTNPEVT